MYRSLSIPHIIRYKPLRPHRLFYMLCVLGCLQAARAVISDVTLDDLRGTQVMLAQQEARVRRLAAQRAAASRRRILAGRLARERSNNAMAVTTSFASKPRKGGKSPGHAPAPREIIKQDLVLVALDEGGSPVPNLPLKVNVRTSGKTAVLALNPLTNERGRVLLQEVGPLPASVEVDIAATAGEEWELPGEKNGSLLLTGPLPGAVRSRAYLASYSGVSEVHPAGISHPVRRRATPTSRTRVIIYRGGNATVLKLHRKFVDFKITAPAGTTVSSPLLGPEPLAVPASGLLQCRTPRADLARGPLPWGMSSETAGGELQGVVTNYELDAAKPVEIRTPKLQLVRLKTLEIPSGVNVGMNVQELSKSLGDLEGKANRKGALGQVKAAEDGAEWWLYREQKIAVKLRTWPWKDGKKDRQVVEAVRFFGAGVTCGGVTHDTPLENLSSLLGQPDSSEEVREEDLFSPLATTNTGAAPTRPQDTHRVTALNYLDQGLRFGIVDGKVSWITLKRPTTLLLNGTTAFVQPSKARVYVASFDGATKTGIATRSQFVDYLRRIGAVKVVDDQDEADYMLSAVARFGEKRSSLTDLIPYKYSCETQIDYTLVNLNSGDTVFSSKRVVGKSSVDLTKDIALALIVGAGVNRLGGKTGRIGSSAIALGTLYNLHRRMKRAANTCPGASTRQAFSELTADLCRTAKFALRISGIDYNRGILTLNGGSQLGIAAGETFQISVLGQPLDGHSNAGTKVDYYEARARNVSTNQTFCELVHVAGKVKDGKQPFDESSGLEMLRKLPDPATGFVAARAWVQFPEIEVISDDDINRSLHDAEVRANVPAPADAPKPSGGQSLLEQLLGAVTR